MKLRNAIPQAMHTDGVCIDSAAQAEALKEWQHVSFLAEDWLRGRSERGMVQARTENARVQCEGMHYEQGRPQRKNEHTEQWSTVQDAALRGVRVYRSWHALVVKQGRVAGEATATGSGVSIRGSEGSGPGMRRPDCRLRHCCQPDKHEERKHKRGEVNAGEPCAVQTEHRAECWNNHGAILP